MFKDYVTFVKASKAQNLCENYIASESSEPSRILIQKAHSSRGHISNFSKISNSVYSTNRLKKQRNVSEVRDVDRTDTQLKISQALKSNTMARNRTRIRNCKSLEESKFHNWTSYTKGEDDF